MISECLSVDIPPQVKILNKVIPILLHFCSLVPNWNVATRHPTRCDIINDVKLFFYSISQDILSQSFDVIQSEVALQKQVH